MALIGCKECGGSVSDHAQACPHRGCPSETAVLQQERSGLEHIVGAIRFVLFPTGLGMLILGMLPWVPRPLDLTLSIATAGSMCIALGVHPVYTWPWRLVVAFTACFILFDIAHIGFGISVPQFPLGCTVFVFAIFWVIFAALIHWLAVFAKRRPWLLPACGLVGLFAAIPVVALWFADAQVALMRSVPSVSAEQMTAAITVYENIPGTAQRREDLLVSRSYTGPSDQADFQKWLELYQEDKPYRSQ